MDENLELLTHIYETADMGAYTITTLINKLKDKENKITEKTITTRNAPTKSFT